MAAVKASRNIVEETLLAWSVEPEWAEARLEAGLGRVGGLASAIHADPLEHDQARIATTGVALWHRPHPDRRWPLWHSADNVSVAFSGVPTGVWRLTGESEPERATAAVAERIAAEPEAIHRLDPPIAVAALSHQGGLAVGADALGVGRLFELRFDGGYAWSNRAGALPLLAGIAPEIDEHAWRVFAAAGWFLGSSTPLRDVRRVAASEIVLADPELPAARELRQSGAREELVRPRRTTRAKSSAEAAAALNRSATELGRAWSAPISVALTGGRDSRVSAAAAIAAGLEVRFNTGDSIPGEAELAARLVEAAPAEYEHDIYTPDPEDEHPDPLADRIERMHLVHDGLRNPQEVRRPTELPHAQLLAPTFSGHGGELGHGFYYPDKARLRTLRRARSAGPIEQLERAARRGHSAATESGYAEYLGRCREVLDLAEASGLHGPVALDFFYAAERLPHRSGLAARSGRTSACTVLEFVRGAFDLKPRHRLGARLHVDVISLLVPDWSLIPFFGGTDGPLPEVRRRRIWEGRDGEELGELINAGGSWEDCFDAGRVREIWEKARTGLGRGEYEHVFYRVAWREAYDRHLATLRRLATSA